MGRKSTKQNKTIYQQIREEQKLTRAAVEDATDGNWTESRLEKIENDVLRVQPEDVVIMSQVYMHPELCNYYCTKVCPIGERYVPEVKSIHELPQITMELLSNLNSLNKDKDRIIDITADGKITDNEKEDFKLFKVHLSEMSMAIEALKLWADKEMT